jgi:hypothetical protein
MAISRCPSAIALCLAILTGCLVLLHQTPAMAQIVELEGRYWFATLEGSAQVKSDSVPGTRFDLKNDLGVENENLPEVRLTFFTGPNSRIRLAYLYGKFEGDTILDQTIEFNGATFAANSRVESEFDVYYGRLGWAYMFPVVPGIFTVGPLLELKGVFIDAELKTTTSGTSVRESAKLPIAFPTVGVMLNLTPHRMLEIFGEASGVPFGNLGYVVDAEAGLRFVPFRWMTLAAGYRFFDVRVGDDDDFGKLRLSGPFVSLSARF